MAKRPDSDEHYVLDLCDEILGTAGRRQATFDWLRGDPSPSRPLGTKLPVDGHWPELGLVIEFQEKQHTEAVPFFDRRHTVSGVGRGEQRRRYDQRKLELISAHGMRLVVIHKAEFTVRGNRIVRLHERDIVIVRARLDAARNRFSDLRRRRPVGEASPSGERKDSSSTHHFDPETPRIDPLESEPDNGPNPQ